MGSTSLLTSAARTADATATLPVSPKADFYIIVDVTVDPASASITPRLQVCDSVSGQWFVVWDGTAITAVGTYTYYFTRSGDPLTAVNDITEVAEVHLHTAGSMTRFYMTHADSDSITYTVAHLDVDPIA